MLTQISTWMRDFASQNAAIAEDETKLARTIAALLGENTVIAEGTSRELLKSTKAIEHYFGSQFS